jgi:cysteine desulfurase
MMKKIYADHAATTNVDELVLDSMIPFLNGRYENPSQPYSGAYQIKKELYLARERIARCINAAPEEIYFTSGGTESNNWVLYGNTVLNNKNGTIITSPIEHHSIGECCKQLSKFGITTKTVDVDAHGIVDSDSLNRLITDDTAIVSIMLANNEIGTIQNIKELVKIAHQHGILFHTDAVQALGHIPVDVKDLDVDFLSSSAHKYNGPKGIGFLYVRKGIDIAPLIVGGSQENNHRAGTENIASIVGMSVALELNCKRMTEFTQKMAELEKVIISAFEKSDIEYVYNCGQKHIPGLINVSFKNISGEMILHRLDLKGILVSTGSACNGYKNEISDVIKSIKVSKEYAEGTIRISLGIDNTFEDAVLIANSIIDVVKSTN